ncbi:flagellar export chaperone FliS [Paenibacillus sp. MDMC362]|uniref:flagellar export chaperone FliS n=1 Tax=Paenibacillus sp. MDMC362 TaxID=2977365 RepID=UPI000DC5F5CC|nr:flagellar export chaperone FliS [Paenibacillus sp. MDMC362]RAR42447.1 flagellar export chaperone FliS [Paenibacillus sp. MDMC362]
MYALNHQQQYIKTKVETAGPGELTLLLYEELYRKLNMAKMLFSKNQQTEMLEKIHGAQAILYELIGTLNFDYELAGQLRELYQFYLSQLNSFVIKRELELLESVIEFAKEFAMTWKEAVHLVKNGKGN